MRSIYLLSVVLTTSLLAFGSGTLVKLRIDFWVFFGRYVLKISCVQRVEY
jgi:hypothetical protein